MENGPPARYGVEIFSMNDSKKIGRVTSGCPSPSLNGNVAMGYVQDAYKKPGTPVQLKIRNQMFSANIAKMPFTSSNYYLQPNK